MPTKPKLEWRQRAIDDLNGFVIFIKEEKHHAMIRNSVDIATGRT